MIGTDADVCYVSCTEGGYEVLCDLLSEGVDVDQLVSLRPAQAEANDVAGYYRVADLADEHDIPVYYPETYELSAERDVEFFADASFDVAIVNGWQRLLRAPVLDTLSIGAFGVHGSASGLPKGRGRSPMNWSLIEDLDRFLLSVIKLDADVDAGAIVDTRKFDVNDHDTIRTMYYKLAMATTDIFVESLPAILDGSIEYADQSGGSTYYPKRTPADGAIHWHDSTETIYNLVRAVGAPYPGAFTEYDGDRMTIWEAVPFSSDLGLNASEGEIVQVFETTGEFVVRTADGTLLVRSWESAGLSPREGIVLESIGQPTRADEADNA
jgi:methionyl-tRNA formyltransferase